MENCCWQGNFKIFKILYCLNPDISKVYPITALKNGHIEIVKFILEKYCSEENSIFNFQEILNQLLIIACQKGNLGIIELLLEGSLKIRANINERTDGMKYMLYNLSGKDNSLSVASKIGYYKIVKYLVEQGAHIDEYSMERAIANSNMKINKFLSENIKS